MNVTDQPDRPDQEAQEDQPGQRDEPDVSQERDGPAKGPRERSVRPGRRERRHQETRGDILRVARQIVIESGAEQLTVREIARRADFAPSALYRYFEGGRPEILFAIAQTSVGVLEGSSRPRASGPAAGRAHRRHGRGLPALRPRAP